MAIGSFAMGRGFGKWVFTAIGLLMSPASHDCWSSGLPKALVESLRPTFGRRDGGGPRGACQFSFGTNDYGPSTTNYGFHESDAAARAVRSHHLSGASWTQLGQDPFPTRCRGKFREMDVLGYRVPHSAALISWFPSFGVPAPLPNGGIGTGWMANLQTDLSSFVQNFVMTRLATSFAAFFVLRAILDTIQGGHPLPSIIAAMFLLAIQTTLTLIKGYTAALSFATADVLDSLWNYMAGTICPIAAGLAAHRSHLELCFPQTGLANSRCNRWSTDGLGSLELITKMM